MRRFFWYFFLLAILSFSPWAVAAGRCPNCGGKLSVVHKLGDKASANNHELVPVSVYQLLSWDQDSPICTRCWLVHLKKNFKGQPDEWARSNARANVFYQPLRRTIRNFPVPDGAWRLYSQDFLNGKVVEIVEFSFTTSADLETRCREYCRQNKLYLYVETRGDGTEFVVASTKDGKFFW